MQDRTDGIPWESLVALAEPYAASRAILDDRLELVLGEPWSGHGAAPSILNYDGVPLELCMSATKNGLRLRLVGDPHTALPAQERVAASVDSAFRLMDATDSRGLRPLLETTFRRTLPATDMERASLPHGGLWLACAVDESPGMAVYTTLDWGTQDHSSRWQRAEDWLAELIPGFSPQGLSPLRRHCEVVSAALEGHSLEDAQAKLYLRQLQSIPLRELGIQEFAGSMLRDFAVQVIQGRPLPLSGIVPSVGFSVVSGAFHGVKVDVCGHCVPRPVAAWHQVLTGLCHAMEIEPLDVESALDRGEVDVAFIGYGHTSAGRDRLNLYLRSAYTSQASVIRPSSHRRGQRS